MLSGSSAERCGYAYRCAGRMSESGRNAAFDPFNVTGSCGGGRAWQRRGFPGSGIRDSLWLHTSCDGAWKFTRGYHGAALFPETEKHAGF